MRQFFFVRKTGLERAFSDEKNGSEAEKNLAILQQSY